MLSDTNKPPIADINVDIHNYSFYDQFKTEISSNIFPLLVLSTFLFLCCRYLFRSLSNIYSNPGGIHYMYRKNIIEMVQYKNPFKFILNSANAGYSGVECNLSSEDDCHVFPLWGIPIYEFHKLLSESSCFNLKDSIQEFAERRKCMSINDYFLLSKGQEVCKKFKPHEEFDYSSFKTLPRPRLYYPFILIMLNTEFLLAENPQVVLLVNVIHIPDDINTFPAQLYQQFTKSADGTIAVIKKIYPSSFETLEVQNERVELCLVCMQREISVVILPCGHSCVCKPCFQQCETCPICRNPSYYYFVSPEVSRH